MKNLNYDDFEEIDPHIWTGIYIVGGTPRGGVF